MPAGVSWGQYTRFGVACLLSMFAGAQAVHHIYQPLKDLDEYKKVQLKKLESTTHKQPTS